MSSRGGRKKFIAKPARASRFDAKQQKRMDNSILGNRLNGLGYNPRLTPQQNEAYGNANGYSNEYEVFKLDLNSKNIIRSLMSEDEINEIDDTQGPPIHFFQNN